MKNYYRTLNLPVDCTEDEVKGAFRRMAFILHPDVAPDKLSSIAQFREIREAYETLVDTYRREVYDAGLEEYQTVISAPTRPLAKRDENGSKRTSRFQQKAKNYQAMMIDDETTAPARFDILCPLEMAFADSISPALYTINVPPKPGAALESNSVFLPGRLHNGALLCVRSLGYINPFTKVRGDLWISVSFINHELFRIYGSNLHYDRNISPWEIALGGEIEVPTLEGFLSVSLPVVFEKKSTVRLSERGVYGKCGKRGDLCIDLHMKVSQSPNLRANRLWREISRLHK